MRLGLMVQMQVQALAGGGGRFLSFLDIDNDNQVTASSIDFQAPAALPNKSHKGFNSSILPPRSK